MTVAELARHPHPVIGTELPGSRILILDEHQVPVPDGQVGEICVTGTSLARGYTHPDPTSTQFTHLDLPGEPAPVRVYRTGDLGLRNTAGALEFRGRADNQVSVNGYRVELGEIESALRTHPGVHDVAVGAGEHHGQTQLTAWLVLADHAELHQVQQHLDVRLPRHMLPRLEAVLAIPLGPTGKADITTLKQTMARPTARDASLVDVVQTIWRETLGVTDVRPDDDFFALGGDSVQATRMIVATRRRLARAIPIRTVFDHSHFADFCTQLISSAGPR
ncbi:MAG: non-ribosomal peptide synthetase [Streptomyces sp.]|uniref:non-ribosomal peptide synthetase n=1 Tax=Streptomyces sp. TaxID=1931 RepID=UPI0025F59A49|nr:non-ribosomal peptide synthetase [Streptomyces sp.]MBW8799074.1 non-ribosomal peptide synthetase [Streptomyces sp.]